ncbi:hypothetical protein YOLOSWAG_84 [Erwinia phage vB_EamM_Yoloswag]|uniref:Uncharacterized protein n=1 Tax=Erwinia phage vB_EamM_Yoloswag TaxID=1958956 RepID=A0A1S6L309_9CAUD|nr:hypothetical protein HOR66_gp084 [Erwinia phage vB_EamM_Yoloswag]AQT28567.1 hypothetical protein YOLOSWAG_84 [Erwinia phage vB_EamM_Yoloswag]
MQFALSSLAVPNVYPERMFYFDDTVEKPTSITASEYLDKITQARTCGYDVQEDKVKCTRLSGQRDGRYYFARSAGVDTKTLAATTSNNNGNRGPTLYSTSYTDARVDVAITDMQAIEKFASTAFPTVPRNSLIKTFGYSFLHPVNQDKDVAQNPQYAATGQLYPDSSIVCIPFDLTSAIKFDVSKATSSYGWGDFSLIGRRYYDYYNMDFIQVRDGKQYAYGASRIANSLVQGVNIICDALVKKGISLQVSGCITQAGSTTDARDFGLAAGGLLRGGVSIYSPASPVATDFTGSGNYFVEREADDTAATTLKWAMLAVRHEGQLKVAVLDENDFTHSTPALPNEETSIDLHLSKFISDAVYVL